jgi:hypothetical protein
MDMRRGLAIMAGIGALGGAQGAEAQTVQALQRQIDDLKAQVAALIAAQGAGAKSVATPGVVVMAPPPAPFIAAAPPVLSAPSRPVAVAQATPAKRSKAWYEKILLRGYTQMRFNEFLSGDRTAPAGRSRLRSVHDGSISDGSSFSLRRIRLVLQGDMTDHLSFYLQPDFATNVSNQSVGERREGFLQLRDAYLDWFVDDAKSLRVRFGQSKVPFGWENMQSSSNRITLDRSDGINSAVPSERDLGVVVYKTPAAVQQIWTRLAKDGQKLFGNYGAFGVGLYNGQGVNRPETNDGLMLVAMATWPFALDGLGDGLAGQVLEVGGAAIRNRVQPELRAGGVSPTAFADDRLGVHMILYPQPLGVQAEWNIGRGPEYDDALRAIRTKSLNGGYVQLMGRVRHSLVGPFMPYGRWQSYRGGWKAALNAPRLETNEVELGVEFQPSPALELTLAYAHMERREADERRTGRAEGDLIRTQLQWNY